MKTQYYSATSLDGFIADEQHSLDWLDQLGPLSASTYPEFFKDVGAICMGSGTYEWLLAHSEDVIAQSGSSWPYTLPTWVFTSRDLQAVPGADIRFVQGDVRPVHAEMAKAAAGSNIWLAGGGELVGQFFDAGLLDEMILQIGSATLGSGKPLFPRKAVYPALQLTGVYQMGAGMVELRYAVQHKV